MTTTKKAATEVHSMHGRTVLLLRLMVLYTILVIAWGAWVRISHSGDGCGESWPLCHGEFIPVEAAKSQGNRTWVEFTHRIMSGLFGILVIWLTYSVHRNFERSHPIRLAAKLSLAFTLTEALLGAKLVLFGLVGSNASGLRGLIMSLHFLNSAILVASLSATAFFGSRSHWRRRDFADLLGRGPIRHLPILGLLGLVILGMTGTIAALSTTLFPAKSLLDGIFQDLNPQHVFLRLRILHPVLGVFVGAALAALFVVVAEATSDSGIRRRSRTLAITLAGTVVIGAITLLWLSPFALRLVHLILAHTIVILFTFWVLELRYTDKTLD